MAERLPNPLVSNPEVHRSDAPAEKPAEAKKPQGAAKPEGEQPARKEARRARGAREETKPEKPQKLEAEAKLLQAVQQNKDASWMTKEDTTLPENPIVRSVFEDIARAPRELVQNPDYLVSQGERLRAALSGDVPHEQQAEARVLLKQINSRIEEMVGVDMTDPSVRQSKDPEVAEKVRYVERAHQHLMAEESGMMSGRPGGGKPESEFKVYKSQDPGDSRGLNRELRERLQTIQDILEANPHRANDMSWLNDRISEVERLTRVPQEQRRKFLDRLYERVDFLDRNRIGMPRRVTHREEEQAALLNEQMLSAKKSLQTKIDQVTQTQPGPSVENEDLQRLYQTVDQGGLTADEIHQRSQELNDLLNQRRPDQTYVLQGTDREMASEVAHALVAKEHVLQFAEDIAPDASNEDVLRYFHHLKYSESDARWVLYTMGNSEQLFEAIQNTRGGYEEIERKIRGLFNKMFDDADANPAEAFENFFSVFYHKPVYDAFMNRLRSVWLETQNHPEFTIQKFEDGVRHEVQFSDEMRELYDRLKAEYSMREYTHNVYHILRARGELKNLAGYSNKLSAEDVDLVFLRDTQLQSAYRLFEKVITHELGWNEWEINPTWFQELEGKGDIIARRVEDLLGEEYKASNNGKGLEPWEINRAVSIARGSIFGVTAIGLDRLGEADPPRGRFGYVGYFGDRLLSYWNPMRHFFYRWWGDSHKFLRLLYTEIKYEGINFSKWNWDSLSRRAKGILPGWDRKDLLNWKNKYKDRVLTNTKQYDNEVKPLIQIANLAGVGGILTRASWRYRGMVDHLIQGRRLPDHNLDYAHFSAEDWIASFRNLRQAGSNFLYFWAEELEDNIKKKDGNLWNQINTMVRAAGEPDAIVTKGKVFEIIRDKNPLYFVNFDNKSLRDGFANTIRGRALHEMGGNWADKTKRDGDIDRLEYNVMKVADTIVRLRKTTWDDDVTREVTKFMSEQDLNDAHQYWEKLREVINSDDKRIIEDVNRRRVPYTIGSEDLDFRETRFTQGGQSMIARSLNDANLLAEKVVQPFFNFGYMLEQLGDTGDFKMFDDYLEGAKQAIDAVHGLDKFYEFSYRINVPILRYIQKSWWGRLPLGLGSLLHFSEKVSMSQVNQGLHAFVGDEQVLGARINQLVKKGFLPPHELDTDRPDITNKYHGDKLRAELGARPLQVLGDMSRSVIPLVLLFIALAASTKQVEEEEK